MVVLLLSSPALAESGKTSVGAVTPWPQVLPCRVFSNVQFEVWAQVGSGNSVPAAMEVHWGAEASRTLKFRSDAQRPFAGNPLDASFPPAEAPRIAVPASADWTQMNILLRCAGPTKLGVEWRCHSKKPCAVGVAYHDEGHDWPDFVGKSDEDLLQAKPGPVAVTPKLRSRAGELATAAARWVEHACRGGRCSPAIDAARSHLDRFLRAPPALRASQVTKRRDSCHHGFEEYDHLDVKARAGGERVSIGMDWEYGWQISFGAGAHALHCRSEGCTMELDGSLGTPSSMTELDGFVIEGEALAVRP